MSIESVQSQVSERVPAHISDAANTTASASIAPLPDRSTLEVEHAELIRERDQLREAREKLAEARAGLAEAQAALAKSQAQLDTDRAAFTESQRAAAAEASKARSTPPALRLTPNAAMAPFSSGTPSRATPDLVQLAREARETGDKTALIQYLRARRA